MRQKAPTTALRRTRLGQRYHIRRGPHAGTVYAERFTTPAVGRGNTVEAGDEHRHRSLTMPARRPAPSRASANYRQRIPTCPL